MTEIKPSTIENEFYFGDLPGSLQYHIDPNSIMEISNITDIGAGTISDNAGFVFESHTEATFNSVIPNTPTGKDNEWNMILLVKKVVDDKIWLKAALRNKATGRIALMTSTNNYENLTNHRHRAIQSCNDDWFVGHYRMSAPMFFWRELVNRLKY